ncbi:MAG: ParB/RepB/Spo0J family partition protein [Chitinivibrionales bacterium]
MLTTKRYEYLNIDKIGFHPVLNNHRALNPSKVSHLEKDILTNGLLEPLVVWERNPGEFYLVGGFHRMEAIKSIRAKNPGYFDRVDVRVVSGDPDEIRALNLKLNADRLDTNITDYFDTVIYLNNANWPRERIAEFLDKSTSWIDDIVRFAPMITPPMHDKLKTGDLSWSKAKEIIQATLKAPAGREKETLEEALVNAHERKVRPLTFRSAIGHIAKVIEEKPSQTFTIHAEDLYALMVTLQGKNYKSEHLERIKKAFPGLLSID